MLLPPTEIPDKLYFKIGDVAKIIGVESYVLRYWETEFPEIKPPKSRTGQRLYRKQDVERILKIRELLYQKKYTIDGARKHLRGEIIERKKAEDERQSTLHFENEESARALKKFREVVGRVVKEMEEYL